MWERKCDEPLENLGFLRVFAMCRTMEKYRNVM